ncbi:MAG TPA: NTP transferase domain-containing protein, partial [Acidobacteriaceae bacterium]|nr:NTP transferase domain-containing protein [Acidobacteriaceae bacterium]
MRPNAPIEADSVTQRIPIPAVVLAAGSSRRLGQPKQLLCVDTHSETLLDRTIRVTASAAFAPI